MQRHKSKLHNLFISSEALTPPELISYNGFSIEVHRRPVRWIRLSLRYAIPTLIIPKREDPIAVLQKHSLWLQSALQKKQAQQEAAAQLKLVTHSFQAMTDILNNEIDHFKEVFSASPASVVWRRMRRKWGSCCTNGKITLNTQLYYLPDHLVRYIIFHELVHLRVRHHGADFKTIIAQRFRNWRMLDKELNVYGYRIMSPAPLQIV